MDAWYTLLDVLSRIGYSLLIPLLCYAFDRSNGSNATFGNVLVLAEPGMLLGARVSDRSSHVWGSLSKEVQKISDIREAWPATWGSWLVNRALSFNGNCHIVRKQMNSNRFIMGAETTRFVWLLSLPNLWLESRPSRYIILGLVLALHGPQSKTCEEHFYVTLSLVICLREMLNTQNF